MSVSRKDIYSHIATLLVGVSNNIYRISVPPTLSADAAKNGFIVLQMGEVIDNSEFTYGDTYSRARFYVQCYVPSTSSGLMNTSKYDKIQQSVDSIIDAEIAKTNQPYSIQQDGVLSMDDFFTNNDKSFYVYTKSFLVTI